MSKKLEKLEEDETKNYHEVDDDDIENVEDEEDDEEEIENDIENCLTDIESIQAAAFELTGKENSDLSQDTASILMDTVNNALSNLSQAFGKYKKEDLQKKLNKIRETNIGKNGIL